MNLKQLLGNLKSSSGEVTWSSPSNLALVKYWGKTSAGLPINPSLSFSLKNSRAITTLKWKYGKGKVVFYLGDKLKPSFYPKIERFLNRLQEHGLNVLKNIDLKIYSHNTFPHSVGIASSAAGFSSLALCILSMFELDQNCNFYKIASYMASLGSGSAARSIYPRYVEWKGEAAREIEVSKIFANLQDAILVVSSNIKKHSSSYGHSLMDKHPFKNVRIKVAKQNFLQLKKILKGNDFGEFARMVEQETLYLHALMMTSNPPLIYMEANSLKIIEIIRNLMNVFPITYSLDAGANVHLLYPKNFNIKPVINKLKHFVINVIYDEVGNGPQLLC